MKGQINVYTCPIGHETVTRDLDQGTTPFMIGCKESRCTHMAKSCMYGCDQSQVPEWEWYKPKTHKGHTMDEIDHIIQGGLLLRRIIVPEVIIPVHSYLKVGWKVWHPVFLWGTIIHPPTLIKTFVEFDFEKISYNIAPGKRTKLRRSKDEHKIHADNYKLFAQVMEIDKLPEAILNDLRMAAPDVIVNEPSLTRSAIH